MNDTLPDWERVLASAAHLQRILPDAVLVGGSASAVYAEHRLSTDADHVLTDLRQRFDRVLAELESVAGWQTARVTRPVQVLGSLDGIETGIRQLIRDEPLETVQIEYLGQNITVPTEAEMLRIKGVLSPFQKERGPVIVGRPIALQPKSGRSTLFPTTGSHGPSTFPSPRHGPVKVVLDPAHPVV